MPIVLLVVVGWMICAGIRDSLRAEENLHATLFVIRFVEQHVADQGRWPRSWDELEQIRLADDPPRPMSGELTVVRIGGAHGYIWPAQSPHLQEYVEIDFEPDMERLLKEDPMEFEAIRPIGPYYEYRDYGFVDSLQATLRGTVSAGTSEPTP